MEENRNEGLLQFRRKGSLTGRKLAEYLPAMIITNLSTLLLVTVDGIVAGNLVGKDALASINIFYPVTIATGAVTMLVASGISTSLSTAMGKNNVAELDRIKGASLRIMAAMAVIVGIVQIPFVLLVIRSYGLSEAMYKMTMQYAIGIMICSPLGLVSTVGTYEMQIAGKMKMLMKLSVIEGIANLVFDVLYMGVFHMGVAGAGFGTATANLIRCSTTVIYLLRYTDMFKSNTGRVSLIDVKTILGIGVPDFSYSMVLAVQNYLIMQILLAAFGSDGGAIKGVCSLCFSITNVFMSGISGSMRPLMGLYAGADDKAGLKILMSQGSKLNTISAGLSTVVIWLHPEWFFAINGVNDIPEGGLLAVRLFSLCLILEGCNNLLRLYLINRKDSKYATKLTVMGNATLPVFAFILWKAVPAPYIFLAYLATAILVFEMSYSRYRKWIRDDRKEIEENGEDIVLYMSVKPEEAVEASRELRRFAKENGISNKIAFRMGLCLEEMVAYAKAAKMIDPKTQKAGSGKIRKLIQAILRTEPHTDSVNGAAGTELNVEVMVRYEGKDEAIFVQMDDGKCIALDKNELAQKHVTDNYGLLSKIAKSVEYQYILNLNQTRFTFDEK